MALQESLKYMNVKTVRIVRSQCTKAKEGNNRKIHVNQKWEQQKEMIRQQLSDEKTGEIYDKSKIDVETVFGFMKANLSFIRMSERGKEKVENELGFAFMAVNLRKYTAKTLILINDDENEPSKQRKMVSIIQE